MSIHMTQHVIHECRVLAPSLAWYVTDKQIQDLTIAQAEWRGGVALVGRDDGTELERDRYEVTLVDQDRVCGRAHASTLARAWRGALRDHDRRRIHFEKRGNSRAQVTP